MDRCEAAAPPAPLHKYPLVPLPAYECSLQGLQTAYAAPAPFTRGGLLFYNKEVRLRWVCLCVCVFACERVCMCVSVCV